MLGMTCPGLGSPVQEGHEEAGKDLVKSARIVHLSWTLKCDL